MADDRDLEVAKMCQDAFKHMTTFCTGAIAVAATVIGAFFPKPEMVLALGFSFSCFLTGAGTAMFGLYYTPHSLDPDLPTSSANIRLKALKFLLGMTVAAAYIGVFAFGWFLARNLLGLTLITASLTAF